MTAEDVRNSVGSRGRAGHVVDVSWLVVGSIVTLLGMLFLLDGVATFAFHTTELIPGASPLVEIFLGLVGILVGLMAREGLHR